MDAKAIAKGLTQVQREVLAQDLRYVFGEARLQWCPRVTLEALERKDILSGACLTPLGLSVRTELLKERG